MNIKYKSSILGVVMMYFAPAILLVFLANYYKNLTTLEESNKIFLFLLVALFVLTIVNSIRTRYIEVTDFGISIKNFKTEKFVEYKDIVSIHENHTNGVEMAIKYRDNKTGKIYLLKTIPGPAVGDYSVNLTLSNKKTKMFSYIKEQMDKANSSVTN